MSAFSIWRREWAEGAVAFRLLGMVSGPAEARSLVVAPSLEGDGAPPGIVVLGPVLSEGAHGSLWDDEAEDWMLENGPLPEKGESEGTDAKPETETPA